MKQKSEIFYHLLIMLSLITLTITCVFGWMVLGDRTNFSSYTIGDLNFSLGVNDDFLIEEITLDDLAYIDFQKDIIENLYGVNNYMATSIKIKIRLDEDSASGQSYVRIIEPENQKGLLMLLVYEGVNFEGEYETDYAQIFNEIIEDLETPSINNCRQAIDDYNQSVRNKILEHVLNATDTITFQLVLWGDYDELEQKNNYLDKTYTISLVIEMIQAGGVEE